MTHLNEFGVDMDGCSGDHVPAPVAGTFAPEHFACLVHGNTAPTYASSSSALKIGCCPLGTYHQPATHASATPTPTAASGAEMPQVTAEDVEMLRRKVKVDPAPFRSRILALCEYALAHQNGGAV